MFLVCNFVNRVLSLCDLDFDSKFLTFIIISMFYLTIYLLFGNNTVSFLELLKANFTYRLIFGPNG